MRTLLFLAMAAACLLAQPKPPTYLGLDDLVAMALRQSPDLAAYRAELEASLAAVKEAESLRKPALNLQAGAGEVGVEAAGSDRGALATGSLRASQLLYDFGKSGGRIAAQRFLGDAADAQLRQRISDKILEVKRAYYRLLQAKHLIAVAEEDVRLNERQLHRAKRYYEAGIRTKIDVTDAEVNLLQAKKRLSDTRYDYLRAGYDLARVVGVDTEARGYEILTPALGADATDDAMPNESLEALETFAYAHRHRLRACLKAQKSEEALLASVEGEYYPTLGLEAGVTLNQTNDRGLEAYFPDAQYDGMVTLRWNLYQGGATRARHERQSANLLRSRALCRQVRLTVRQEVADAYTQVQKAHARVRLAQRLAKAAKEKFQQAQKRYEHGLADFIELQQARQSHIDAEAALVVDIYAFFATVAALDRAVGR